MKPRARQYNCRISRPSRATLIIHGGKIKSRPCGFGLASGQTASERESGKNSGLTTHFLPKFQELFVSQANAFLDAAAE